MRKRCRKSDFVSYIIVDDETGVPVMKKDTLRNKRIDDAQLEKVAGGMDAYDTDRYNEFSLWWRFFDIFSSKHDYQDTFNVYWERWKKAGFKPDANTFIKNNSDEIKDRLAH